MADDFLIRILRDKQDEVAGRQAALPLALLRRRALEAPPPRTAVLRADTLRVIAEVKRGSPSAGTFDGTLDAPSLAEQYARGGAAAVSVLTDAPYFQGSLADLEAVRSRVDTPLLRKDFILDEYQVYESRAAGADLVLLIVAALARERLAALRDLTVSLGMQALVEVNNETEALVARDLGADLVGINNRDLHTFTVDLGTSERLLPLFPRGTIVAALSGIKTVPHAARMRAAGADAVLVGEALVRAENPAALLAELAGLR